MFHNHVCGNKNILPTSITTDPEWCTIYSYGRQKEFENSGCEVVGTRTKGCDLLGLGT